MAQNRAICTIIPTRGDATNTRIVYIYGHDYLLLKTKESVAQNYRELDIYNGICVIKQTRRKVIHNN